jgi:hypothetical protein
MLDSIRLIFEAYLDGIRFTCCKPTNSCEAFNALFSRKILIFGAKFWRKGKQIYDKENNLHE